MKLGKRKKYKPKEEFKSTVHYCPLKLHRVEWVVCGKIQNEKWKKCFRLDCEHLDSNAIIAEWENYKESKSNGDSS